MRICIFTGKADIRGGSTRYVTDLSEGLRKVGHTVDIVTRTGNLWEDFLNVRHFARTCDIVHSIDLNPRGFIAYAATRFTRAKLVITVQGSYGVAPLDKPKTAALSRIVYRATAAIVAISSFIKREIEARMKGANIVVITHGVDLSRFEQKPHAEKPERPYILGVGSIKHRKGYETSLRAFIRAHKEMPELRYVIVGAHIDEPKYVQKLFKIVEAEKAQDSVDFVKDISDDELRRLYQNASLFILTSVNEGGHFEGFGLVFLEAGAYGLAQIGTRGNGIEDAIVEGETGILVPQYDVEATSDAILTLMREEALRKKLGEGARKHAQMRAWPNVIREYEQLYADILGRN